MRRRERSERLAEQRQGRSTLCGRASGASDVRITLLISSGLSFV